MLPMDTRHSVSSLLGSFFFRLEAAETKQFATTTRHGAFPVLYSFLVRLAAVKMYNVADQY